MDEPNLMLEPELHAPFKAWQSTPTPKTTGDLLRAVNPIVDSAIKTYGGRNASPNLRSRAHLMTIDAFSKYDPTRAKLRTHLMSHLQGLRRVNASENQVIRIPERVGLDLYHLRNAENELRDTLGRDPSTAELSKHTKVSPKRIAYVRQAQPGLPEGMTSQEGEDEDAMATGPAVVSTNQDPWLDFVYGDLHPTDQLIMEHTLGMHGQRRLPKQLIARKLRLSPGAVSQRAAKIQEKLDSRDELGGTFF